MQDVSSKILCSATHTDAFVFAVRASFVPTPDSAGPANLLAAEFASTFSASLPSLHISSMCHGAHRIAPASSAISAQPRSHPWDAAVVPPSAACAHAGKEAMSSLSSSCLPLFKVSLSHGRCPTAYPDAHISPVTVPVPFSLGETEHTFMTRKIHFHRSGCGESLSGFPPGWSNNFCARMDGDFCNPDAPRIVRISITAAAQGHTSASLLVDGKIVSAIVAKSGVEDAEVGTHGEETVHTVLVLPQGCHALSIVYEDAQPEDHRTSSENVRCYL